MRFSIFFEKSRKLLTKLGGGVGRKMMGLPLRAASPTKHIGPSVIEWRELARERYNTKKFFLFTRESYALTRPYK